MHAKTPITKEGKALFIKTLPSNLFIINIFLILLPLRPARRRFLFDYHLVVEGRLNFSAEFPYSFIFSPRKSCLQVHFFKAGSLWYLYSVNTVTKIECMKRNTNMPNAPYNIFDIDGASSPTI